VRVYDRERNHLIGQPSPATNTAFVPVAISGDMVLFGIGNDVRLWDAKARRPAMTISVGSQVNCIAARSSTVFVGCNSGVLRIDVA
jgi:hypothetical protein